jgi:L-ribulose-5-phosphate 3-epimerase
MSGATQGVSTSGRPDEAAPHPAGAWPTAVKLSMLHADGPLTERFAALAGAGLDGVELSVTGAADAEEVGRAAAGSGLRVATLVVGETFRHSLTSPSAESRAAAVDAVHRNVDYAHDLGVGAVMVSPGFVEGEEPLRVQRDRAADALASVAPAAAEAGVRVCLENLWNRWLLSARDLAAFVDSLGSDVFGVHFDIGNAMRYGLPEHWIEVLGPRIVRVDVKDFSHALSPVPAHRYGVHSELVAVWGPGPWGALDAELLEGDVSWGRVMRGLRDVGYAGWLCAEVAGGDLPRMGRIAEQLQAIRGEGT